MVICITFTIGIIMLKNIKNKKETIKNKNKENKHKNKEKQNKINKKIIL